MLQRVLGLREEEGGEEDIHVFLTISKNNKIFHPHFHDKLVQLNQQPI